MRSKIASPPGSDTPRHRPRRPLLADRPSPRQHPAHSTPTKASPGTLGSSAARKGRIPRRPEAKTI